MPTFHHSFHIKLLFYTHGNVSEHLPGGKKATDCAVVVFEIKIDSNFHL